LEIGSRSFWVQFSQHALWLDSDFFGVQSGREFDDHCFLGHQTDLRYACHVKFVFVASDGKREYFGVLDSTRQLV